MKSPIVQLKLVFIALCAVAAPRSLAQTIAPVSEGASTSDDDDVDDDPSDGEDCEYDDSLADYLSCAKAKISTTTLIGAGIGVTLGIFALAFVCIWLTKKKRLSAAERAARERANAGDEERGSKDRDVPKITFQRRESVPPVPPLPRSTTISRAHGRAQPSKYGEKGDPRAARVEDAGSSSDEMSRRRQTLLNPGVGLQRNPSTSSTRSHRVAPPSYYSRPPTSHARSQSQTRLNVPQEIRRGSKQATTGERRAPVHSRNSSVASTVSDQKDTFSREGQATDKLAPAESRAGSPVQPTFGPRPLYVSNASFQPRLHSTYHPANARPQSTVQPPPQAHPKEGGGRASTYLHATRQQALPRPISRASTVSSRGAPPSYPGSAPSGSGQGSDVASSAERRPTMPASSAASSLGQGQGRTAVPLQGASLSLSTTNALLGTTDDSTTNHHSPIDVVPVHSSLIPTASRTPCPTPAVTDQQRQEILVASPADFGATHSDITDKPLSSTINPSPPPTHGSARQSTLPIPSSSGEDQGVHSDRACTPSPTPPLSISKRNTLLPGAARKTSLMTGSQDQGTTESQSKDRQSMSTSDRTQNRKSVIAARASQPSQQTRATDVAPQSGRQTSPPPIDEKSDTSAQGQARTTSARGGTMPHRKRTTVGSQMNLLPSYYQPNRDSTLSSSGGSMYSVDPGQAETSNDQKEAASAAQRRAR